MGLQFFPDKRGALREARRALVPGGRLLLNVPGPTPPIFGILANGLARHVKPDVAAFVNQVFSVHETRELEDLLCGVDLVDSVSASEVRLRLAPPEEFLWQYVHSTPLAAAVAAIDGENRAALAHEIVGGWEPFVEHNGLILVLPVVRATAHAG